MITEDQFNHSAGIIGCEAACIKAVYHVEASGSGYLKDGRIKILFEGHRFWKQLKNAGVDCFDFLMKHPEFSNVLHKKWIPGNPEYRKDQWERMSQANKACKLIGVNPELALKSASFGSFQIMGENCVAAGYATAQEMITSYNNSGEAEELDSFTRFVKYTKLDDELRALNFQSFADGYNGTASKLNHYAPKLFAAYMTFKI